MASSPICPFCGNAPNGAAELAEQMGSARCTMCGNNAWDMIEGVARRGAERDLATAEFFRAYAEKCRRHLERLTRGTVQNDLLRCGLCDDAANIELDDAYDDEIRDLVASWNIGEGGLTPDAFVHLEDAKNEAAARLLVAEAE